MTVHFSGAYRLVRTDYQFVAPVANDDTLIARRVANRLEPGVDNLYYQDPTDFTILFTGPENQALQQAMKDLQPAMSSPDPYVRAYGQEAFLREKLDLAAKAQNLDVTAVVKQPEAFPIDGPPPTPMTPSLAATSSLSAPATLAGPNPFAIPGTFVLPGLVPSATSTSSPEPTAEPLASPPAQALSKVPAPEAPVVSVETPPPPEFEENSLASTDSNPAQPPSSSVT